SDRLTIITNEPQKQPIEPAHCRVVGKTGSTFGYIHQRALSRSSRQSTGTIRAQFLVHADEYGRYHGFRGAKLCLWLRIPRKRDQGGLSNHARKVALEL